MAKLNKRYIAAMFGVPVRMFMSESFHRHRDELARAMTDYIFHAFLNCPSYSVFLARHTDRVLRQRRTT